MTKQQYEAMEPFKAQFALAKTNFVRISRSDLDIIRRTYNDVFKKNLQVSNMNCNSCVIKMMKAMGAEVEKFERWYEARHGKNAVENEGNSNVPEQSEA